MDLEFRLEVDGVQGEWSTGEESELLGVFAVGGVEEIGLLKHLLDDEGGGATADDDLLLSDGVEVLVVVGVMVDDVVDFVFNTLKLLGKLVEVNESNALDSGEDLVFLSLEVILEDNVLSEEWLVNTEGRQVTEDLEPESQFVSGAVHNWSIENSSLGSVEPRHEDGANDRVHVSGGVSEDEVLVDWSVLDHGCLEVSFEAVHICKWRWFGIS